VKPKYLQTEPGGRDRWMVSYLDVLTILLIFFVALAAKSLEPPRKSQPDPQPSAPAPSAPAPAGGLADLQKLLERPGVNLHPEDVQLEARGLVISLPQSILFRPGEDRVIASALPVVSQIADILRDVPNRITLAGHADPVPIHNRRFRNNWELAAARGLRLLDVLSTQYGIPESRFSIASYGANDPRSPNDTSAGRALNRRVEIVIQDTPR
jgi:chemotaxis protein MotB